MRRPGLVVVVVVSFVLLAVAACGGDAKVNSLPLTARVIGRGGFRGFTPGGRHSSDTPKAYLTGDAGLTPPQREAWIARLASEGFKKDLTEFLNGTQGPRTGLSGVMQLGSAASARAELAAELRFFESQGRVGFLVKTIPGAVGFGSSGPASAGENVLFADGPFLYLVGNGWVGTTHNPKHSALIDAATKLYMRVHGHPAR